MKIINRFLKSIAWKFFYAADFKIKNKNGNIIPLRQKGDFDSFREVYILREFDNIFPLLRDVSSWIDLGCNIGLFSLALLEKMKKYKDICNVLLVDANNDCIKRAKELAKINNFSTWNFSHSLIGIEGQKTAFFKSNSSLRSTIYKPKSKENRIVMQSISLKSLIKNEKYDLIKIDIEGAESILFETEGDLLAQFKYGIVEWHAPYFTGRKLESWILKHNLNILHIQNAENATGNQLDADMGVLVWSRN